MPSEGELVDFGARQAISKLENAITTLRKGGGDGNSGDMLERVSKLEVKVDRLVADVGELQKSSVATREDLATLKERVAHLPSKGYIAAWTSSAIALIIAIVSALTIYQHSIQTFFHQTP